MKARLSYKTLADEPIIIESLSSVVILDAEDHPIVALKELNGSIILLRASEPGFKEAVKEFGIGLNASVRIIKP